MSDMLLMTSNSTGQYLPLYSHSRVVLQMELSLCPPNAKQYADTFHGLGCITEVTHHIELDPNCKPVIHPPRKVAVTIRSKVKELERMECLEVIERVYGPTDWVNSMVTIIKKNGQLRICIDPRDLNRAIKHEYYPMRTVEEIVARMPNAKFFSVLDASSGFLRLWLVSMGQSTSRVVCRHVLQLVEGLHLLCVPMPFSVLLKKDPEGG